MSYDHQEVSKLIISMKQNMFSWDKVTWNLKKTEDINSLPQENEGNNVYEYVNA